MFQSKRDQYELAFRSKNINISINNKINDTSDRQQFTVTLLQYLDVTLRFQIKILSLVESR